MRFLAIPTLLYKKRVRLPAKLSLFQPGFDARKPPNMRSESPVESVKALSAYMQVTATTEENGVSLRTYEFAAGELEPASAAIAATIVHRRLGHNPELVAFWQQALDSGNPPNEEIRVLLSAGLLQDLGSREEPASNERLHGFVEEAIWRENATTDFGRGCPIRIEGNGWSVTETGGDGLCVYENDGREFSFSLWECKFHGSDQPVRDTVNRGCRQLRNNGLEYLSRFALVAQETAGENQSLARFYARMPWHWLNKTGQVLVGVSVGMSLPIQSGQFANMHTYFGLAPSRHDGHIHAAPDFHALANAVRETIWRGCGL